MLQGEGSDEISWPECHLESVGFGLLEKQRKAFQIDSNIKSNSGKEG